MCPSTQSERVVRRHVLNLRRSSGRLETAVPGPRDAPPPSCPGSPPRPSLSAARLHPRPVDPDKRCTDAHVHTTRPWRRSLQRELYGLPWEVRGDLMDEYLALVTRMASCGRREVRRPSVPGSSPSGSWTARRTSNFHARTGDLDAHPPPWPRRWRAPACDVSTDRERTHTLQSSSLCRRHIRTARLHIRTPEHRSICTGDACTRQLVPRISHLRSRTAAFRKQHCLAPQESS